jgi:hypothetical protein
LNKKPIIYLDNILDKDAAVHRGTKDVPLFALFESLFCFIIPGQKGLSVIPKFQFCYFCIRAHEESDVYTFDNKPKKHAGTSHSSYFFVSLKYHEYVNISAF